MSPKRWWLGKRHHHPLTKTMKRTRWLRLSEGWTELVGRFGMLGGVFASATASSRGY